MRLLTSLTAIAMLTFICIVSCGGAAADTQVRLSVTIYNTDKGVKTTLIKTISRTFRSTDLNKVGVPEVSSEIVSAIRDNARVLPDDAPKRISYSLEQLEQGNYGDDSSSVSYAPKPTDLTVASLSSGEKQQTTVEGEKTGRLLASLNEHTSYFISNVYVQGYSLEKQVFIVYKENKWQIDGNSKITLIKNANRFNLCLSPLPNHGSLSTGKALSDIVRCVNQSSHGLLHAGTADKFAAPGVNSADHVKVASSKPVASDPTIQRTPQTILGLMVASSAIPFSDYIAEVAVDPVP